MPLRQRREQAKLVGYQWLATTPYLDSGNYPLVLLSQFPSRLCLNEQALCDKQQLYDILFVLLEIFMKHLGSEVVCWSLTTAGPDPKGASLISSEQRGRKLLPYY